VISTGGQRKADDEPGAPDQIMEGKFCSKAQQTGTCTSKTSAWHCAPSRSERTCSSFYRAQPSISHAASRRWL